MNELIFLLQTKIILILTVTRAGIGHKGLLSLHSRNSYKRGDSRVTKERSIDPDLMYTKLIHCKIGLDDKPINLVGA